MQFHQPNIDQQWLDDFSTSFVRGTHRLVGDLSVQLDCDRVVIRGRARCYYAVQLAIHTVRNLTANLPRFSETILRLCVEDHQLELKLIHPRDLESDVRKRVRPRTRSRELLSTSS